MVQNLHSKTKGVLGEIAVAKDLLAKGYQVFAELGDNSRVDLIVMGKDYPQSRFRSRDCRANLVL